MASSSASNASTRRAMPELPGFYFDVEKGRYFRIQPNHAPTGHSQESVKRKRAEEEAREKRLKVHQKVTRQTVQRHRALYQPWTGVDRERGVALRPRAEEETVIFSHFVSRKKIFQFHPRQHSGTFSQVIRHPFSGLLIGGGSFGNSCNVSLCYPDPKRRFWKYDHSSEQVLIRAQYRLSSISLSMGNLLLSTMDSGPTGDSVLVLHRVSRPGEGVHQRWLTDQAPIERLNTTHTLWCSAASPQSDAKFAIGTSDGLYMLNNAFNAHWSYYQALTPKTLRGRPGKTDVTAVGFYQDTLVAAGMRNSAIFLYDERSSSHAMNLLHTERVDKIYHVHGHLLMAAGPTSVRIYDVRAASNVIQKSAKFRSPFRQCSQPYLTFPECTPGVNNVMDVSAKNNLLACAPQGHTVQLFSLRTGQQVASPINDHSYSKPINCLRFEERATEDIPDGPQSPGLLVGTGTAFDHWAWH